MLKLQNTILDLIAKGEPLKVILDRLCLEMEKLIEAADCSILLVDPSGLLHPVAAPGFPEIYNKSMNGVLTGPNMGSTGSAVYNNIPVHVEDIERDPRWTVFRLLALPLGWQACAATPLRNAAGKAIGALTIYLRQKRGLSDAERKLVAACVELSELALANHQRELDVEYRATCDPLTGLPNKPACDEAMLRLRCDAPGSWGVIIISVDKLQAANEKYGFEAGNAQIVEIARRLSAVLEPDRLFRTAGNEFTAILQDENALKDINNTASVIFNALSAPISYAGEVFRAQVTIGSALLSAQDTRPESVLYNAGFALFHAKETRRGSHVHYGPGIGSRMVNRRVSVQEVTEALQDNRVDAQYQPVLRLDTYEIVGFEALCRLTNRDGEVLPAAVFKEAFSDASVALETTQRMLSIVARDIRAWHDQGLPVPFVGINITSADFAVGDLPAKIEDAFAKAGADLKHLVLEVTEDAYIGQRDQIVADGIMELKIKDVQVAFDDFGTGHATLGHLLSVPIDIIKIDQAFTRKLVAGGPGTAIVSGLIQIARDLDIKAIAEGIETAGQVEILRGLGCELGQGYAFSRPVARETAAQLLQKHGHGAANALPLMPSAVG